MLRPEEHNKILEKEKNRIQKGNVTMKRTFIKQALALSLLCSAGLIAREIRTPLPIPMTATSHYPMMYCSHYKLDSCHGKSKCDSESMRNMHFAISGAGYMRNAEDAYSSCGWTNKVPFSTLLFGKSDFRVIEAFPGGAAAPVVPSNPFVSVSTISPRYEYDERGAVLGACLGTTFCDRWHTGLRARLPIRDIDVHAIASGNDLTGESTLSTLNDLFTVRQEPNTDGGADVTQAYAIRLDFLSSLAQTPAIGSTPANMIVKWPATGITIANVTASAPPTAITPDLAVIGSSTGVMPVASQWADKASTITSIVAANGSGVGNGIRGRFDNIAYGAALALDPIAQSKLFVVPTKQVGAGLQITGPALQALGFIQSAVNALDVNSVQDFFTEQGLNFWDGHTQGIGDLDLDLYLGRAFGCNNQLFAELQAGIRAPTGKKLCDCRYVLKQSTGNNGHLEARVSTMLGWDACRTVKIRLDGSYNYVAKKTERIAAPFVGATVKNIGPCINADIKWHYFTADANISFFASKHCGFDVSYQFYGKGCDKICPCVTATTDFAGRENQIIDTAVASRLTKVYSHKARAEFFMSTKCCELFVGGAYTFAGRNAMRDVDCFLGMQVRF